MIVWVSPFVNISCMTSIYNDVEFISHRGSWMVNLLVVVSNRGFRPKISHTTTYVTNDVQRKSDMFKTYMTRVGTMVL